MACRRHAQFIARTVLVRDGSVDQCSRVLNGILAREKLFEQYRRTRTYEKPTQTRRRINYEKCRAIYNEDMSRKIKFILRTNREDPYPACS
ncbi:mitochondrial ribosomal protein S21 [Augochlora pura]